MKWKSQHDLKMWLSDSAKFLVLFNKTYWLRVGYLSAELFRGVYFRKFNPLLFAGLSLPWTKTRPKHNEGVAWSQNKSHFWTQYPLKPLYRLLVWPYLQILIFWIFLFFGVIWLIGGTTRDLLWVMGGNIRPCRVSQCIAMR